MSTELRLTCSLMLAVSMTACSRPAPITSLGALCRGADVEKAVQLVVDNTRPTAGAAATKLAGQRMDLDLAFRAGEAQAECNGRTGRVAFQGELPAPLAGATATDRIGLWRINGDAVAIDFNPDARDNNHTLVLPLSGAAGRWGMSTFAGEVISGRAQPR